jgi:hypothetical protein
MSTLRWYSGSNENEYGKIFVKNIAGSTNEISMDRTILDPKTETKIP